MENHCGPSIRFVLHGHRYELAREDVEQKLADVAPDAIRKHAVRVKGIWFPVIQAFEVATGIPRTRTEGPRVRVPSRSISLVVSSEVSQAPRHFAAELSDGARSVVAQRGPSPGGRYRGPETALPYSGSDRAGLRRATGGSAWQDRGIRELVSGGITAHVFVADVGGLGRVV